MTEKEFFEFALDEYKADLALANSLYQRSTLMVPALVVVAGAAYTLRRIDLIGQTFEQLPVCLLQLGFAAGTVCVVVSTVCLFAAAMPRTYPKLTKPFFWNHWRQLYWGMLVENAPQEEERNLSCLADATRVAMLERVLESQGMVSYINQKRQRAFQRAVLFLMTAVAALGVQAASSAWLTIRKVETSVREEEGTDWAVEAKRNASDAPAAASE